MTGFILATKTKQTSGFDEAKNRQTQTLLKINPCFVTQIKTLKTDGYQAIVFGVASKKASSISKVISGQSKKAGIENPLSFYTEIRFTSQKEEIQDNEKLGLKINEQVFFPGDQLNAEKLFVPKDKVQVSGVTKGKGFAGVVKRHGFAGGPKTHGQSDRWRAPGSIGSGTTPGRIWKGKKMAGRMGGDYKTVKGLKVVEVKADSILLSGLVPGSIGSIIKIVKTKNG